MAHGLSHRFWFDRDQIIQAGAGTGKTHALLTQYLHLCLGLTAHQRPIDPKEIMVLTFTEKAATELQNRIEHRMKSLSIALSPFDEQSVRNLEPEIATGLVDEFQANEWKRRIEVALLQLDTAPIGTFHSIFGRLIRKYAALLSIHPSFDVMQPGDASALRKQTVKRCLLKALDGGFQQTSLHLSKQGCAQLIDEFGFSSKFGPQLVEWVAQCLSDCEEDGADFGTLADGYSISEQQKAWDAFRAAWLSGRENLHTLLPILGDSSLEKWKDIKKLNDQLHKRLIAEPEMPSSDVTWTQLNDDLSEISSMLGRCRARRDADAQHQLARVKQSVFDCTEWVRALYNTTVAAPLCDTLKELLMVCAAMFREEKQRKNVIDFTDLLSIMRQLLTEFPIIREEIIAQYPVLLVDEFQDTSRLQIDIISLLCSNRDTSVDHEADDPEPGGRLLVVGDRKQTIYQFRGADVSSFLTFSERMKSSGAQTITMSISRRSLPGVISLVNDFFARLFGHHRSKAWNEFPDDAVDRMAWNEATDPLVPYREQGERAHPCAEFLVPSFSLQHTYRDPIARESEMIARRIAQLVEEGTRPDDVMLLLRRFTHVFDYISALRRHRIPVQDVILKGFYQQREVADMAAMLSWVIDPTDPWWTTVVLRSPFVGLSDEHVFWFFRHQRLHAAGLISDESWEGLSYHPDQKQHAQKVARLVLELSQNIDLLSPDVIVDLLWTETGYRRVMAQLPSAVQSQAIMEQVVQLAQETALQGISLREWVVKWREKMTMDPIQEGTPVPPIAVDLRTGVRILTVHQSKGLESPIVVIAGCGWSDPAESIRLRYHRSVGLAVSVKTATEKGETIPARRYASILRAQQQEESKRLFYVAATRAKDRLVFASEGASKRGSWGFWVREYLGSVDSATMSTVEI